MIFQLSVPPRWVCGLSGLEAVELLESVVGWLVASCRRGGWETDGWKIFPVVGRWKWESFNWKSGGVCWEDDLVLFCVLDIFFRMYRWTYVAKVFVLFNRFCSFVYLTLSTDCFDIYLHRTCHVRFRDKFM